MPETPRFTNEPNYSVLDEQGNLIGRWVAASRTVSQGVTPLRWHDTTFAPSYATGGYVDSATTTAAWSAGGSRAISSAVGPELNNNLTKEMISMVKEMLDKKSDASLTKETNKETPMKVNQDEWLELIEALEESE